MSNSPSHDHSRTAARPSSSVRHSKEDALTEREFELLLEGARELKAPFDFEARLCILLAGKLGLRAGEIAHLKADWIDWYGRSIDIPDHEPCTDGTVDGEVCGYCRGRAIDRLTTNNLTIDEAKAELRAEFDREFDAEALHAMALERRDAVNITFDEAIAERWTPKTPTSARSVPFDFDMRTQLCIERFGDRYDAFPKSRATVNRRINRAAEHAGLESVYPHCLRATSASFHAMRDVSPYALMSIMGWERLSTARVYIQGNEENAAKEVRSKHR